MSEYLHPRTNSKTDRRATLHAAGRAHTVAHSVARPTLPRVCRRPGATCSHCGGTGSEPQPFDARTLERGAISRVAREAGIDKSAVSRLLSGQTVPSLATIVLTADALGVSESRLIHYPPVWHRLLQEIAEDGE